MDGYVGQADSCRKLISKLSYSKKSIQTCLLLIIDDFDNLSGNTELALIFLTAACQFRHFLAFFLQIWLISKIV